ncbi:G patch domain-containing protein 4 [Ceratina calcarata]|uniref:G patch domain-containing protein 4 n=1 Tax=Ceratina calcarata TaxID=156304 RepID=A0AAJ7IXF3_9HYME|nr:G patch domain-containing protein 4 [Ceratina calcarata]
MNDFARAQLMKYGWSEGKGLGKHESGIAQALKPKLKFDTTGVGHKNDDYNNWWESAFNKAANNITVKSQTNGVFISVSKGDKTENVPENKFEETKSKSSIHYGNFLKSSVLLNGSLVEDHTSRHKTEDKEDVIYTPLTDEELFKICGGRTAHKGARHGLTLNGKLKRIAKQEEALLNTNLSFNVLEKIENNNNNNNISDDEHEKITNERAVLPIASIEEIAERKVSKTTKRKTRRSINDLSHKLNILCNLIDSDEKSMNEIVDEESKGKNNDRRKKKKKRKISDSGVKIEKDVLFPTNHKLEKEISKKDSKEYPNSQDNTEYTKTSKKRKELKVKKRQNEFNEYPAKKFKKLDKNHVDSLPVENIDLLQCKLQREHIFTEPVGSHEIKDCLTESPYAYTEQKADQLNKKLRKKKRAKRLRKERIKLEKITECLKAVNFNIPEPSIEQCNKKKLKEVSEKLIDTSTTIDRTECLKKRRKDKNKSK